ncbi:hypothetical protein CTKZ_07910 [Cellulomonas algicola]|uniref:Uncharacterized protein n=1 Tax=Cellulomonas algicola TaxID=2071633 RepID=A0A401UX30_9CELL|nr:hypothetical protein CTKZ_07910 [Cellulomonas algicola]
MRERTSDGPAGTRACGSGRATGRPDAGVREQTSDGPAQTRCASQPAVCPSSTGQGSIGVRTKSGIRRSVFVW